MNYIDILNNDKVIENYNKIDNINPYPFNHGLKHVKNVCKIMDRLCKTINITGEEKEALLIAAHFMILVKLMEEENTEKTKRICER